MCAIDSIIDFLCLSLKDHYNQEWAAACAATVNTMQQMQVFFNSAAVLKLGVDGSLLFIQLLHYVPAELSSYRFKYVADILSVALETTITVEGVKELTEDANWLDGVLQCVDIGKPSMKLLWKATFAIGKPCTQFLAPPVSDCIICGSSLTTHNKSVTVICYTAAGPIPAVKVSLRCDTCRINYRYGNPLFCQYCRLHLFYRYDKYGCDASGGYRYYENHVRPFVCGSQTCFVERSCYENWCAFGLGYARYSCNIVMFVF